MIGLATLAAEEFRTRQQQAQRRVDARQWTASQATDRLLPWLALAGWAGADLPELRMHNWMDQPVRRCWWDIARRDDIAAALANARDTLLDLDRHDDRTRRLLQLANEFGCPPYRPGPVRIEQRDAA